MIYISSPFTCPEDRGGNSIIHTNYLTSSKKYYGTLILVPSVKLKNLIVSGVESLFSTSMKQHKVLSTGYHISNVTIPSPNCDSLRDGFILRVPAVFQIIIRILISLTSKPWKTFTFNWYNARDFDISISTS